MDTRGAIIESAFDLFTQKRFSAITVQDIINHAGCSRFSFYKYFEDKYELMRLYYARYVGDLIFQQYDGGNYADIQVQIFRFIKDSEPYFQNVKELDGPDSFWSFLSQYATIFFTAVKCENDDIAALTELDQIVLLFTVEGAVAVFKECVNDRQGELSPEEVSNLLCSRYPVDFYVLPKHKIAGFMKRFADALKERPGLYDERRLNEFA